eukprot:m.12957 g.12957  ORF g.12957 m.12957 type:complete len:78 (-) comp5882_c0_seq1:68-301(-)
MAGEDHSDGGKITTAVGILMNSCYENDVDVKCCACNIGTKLVFNCWFRLCGVVSVLNTPFFALIVPNESFLTQVFLC